MKLISAAIFTFSAVILVSASLLIFSQRQHIVMFDGDEKVSRFIYSDRITGKMWTCFVRNFGDGRCVELAIVWQPFGKVSGNNDNLKNRVAEKVLDIESLLAKPK